MRKLLSIILVLLYQLGISTGLTSDHTEPSNNGVPSAESYTEKQAKSKVPWDMIIQDGHLYIGGGDYNDNTGPVDIHYMDLSNGQWSISGTLNEEAIGKFIRIDDRIYAPGFDAKGAKSTGNFYWLENGQWHENTSIPNAAHNYDIIKYDNKLLFATGTWNGNHSPVQASDDHGITFYDIPFYKDNINIIEEYNFDYTRVYDFFVSENGLFCIFIPVVSGKSTGYEFYQYIDHAFHFVSAQSDTDIQIIPLKQEPISSEITFEGYTYIAAYHLSRTKDFKTTEKITLPRNEIAIDLLIDNNNLYVLCAETENTSCSVRIYRYIYNSFFYPVASFESENLPISFAKYENRFYIGLGKQGFNDEAIGTIITVETSIK